MTLMASNLNYDEGNVHDEVTNENRFSSDTVGRSDDIDSRVEEDKANDKDEFASPFEDAAFLAGESRQKEMSFGH